MEFCHRPACLADLPHIVEIYNSTIPSRLVTSDLEPITVESRLRWFQEHADSERPIWVVDFPTSSPHAGQLAGWLSFSAFHSRPAYAGTAELSIYLHEDCRQQGLGKYLLAEAIKAAPALHIHTLVGLIFAHNQPSLNLFSKAGFERWAHLPRVAEMDGLRYDLVIAGKTLS